MTIQQVVKNVGAFTLDVVGSDLTSTNPLTVQPQQGPGWWGPAGRATAAPVPRQRERQPSCVLSVSTYVPLRSFPRKSSMSEAGAGMSAQSPTRSWPPPGLGLSTPKIAL